MRVQKLSVEMNKFGAAEVSAKIDGKTYDVLVVAVFKPYEGYVAEQYALTDGNGITAMGDAWDINAFFNRDEEGFSEDGRAKYKYLFEAAQKLLATYKPEPLPPKSEN